MFVERELEKRLSFKNIFLKENDIFGKQIPLKRDRQETFWVMERNT